MLNRNIQGQEMGARWWTQESNCKGNWGGVGVVEGVVGKEKKGRKMVKYK